MSLDERWHKNPKAKTKVNSTQKIILRKKHNRVRLSIVHAETENSIRELRIKSSYHTTVKYEREITVQTDPET